MKSTQITLLLILLCFIFTWPGFLGHGYASSLRRDKSFLEYHVFDDAARSADSKHAEYQERTRRINSLYNRAKSHYQSKKYIEAKRCFEELLEIDNSYEPARIFLESVVVLQGISECNRRIEDIKLRLADIMSEYDRRVQRTDMLAVKYFLELAQKECQIGNFQAAENHYNLCYKIHPHSKESIEWFVVATHDLMLLYNKLEEENKGIEELMASFR